MYRFDSTGSRDERRVLELHAVMDLIALPKPAQDADRVLDRRLADHDRLESALERRILFDVFPVFVQRGRADGVQFAAGEHRLQHVRCIHGSFRRAGSDDCMELVDEKNHLSLGVRHFLEHGFEPLLELAAILCAGDERTHVERDDPLVFQTLGDVLPHDPLRQPLDDRGFADARLTNEHRVVLGASGQYLNHTADLVVSADHRIELALPRQLGQIPAVSLERLIGPLGVLARHTLRAAHGCHRLKDGILRDAALLQCSDRGRPRSFGGNRNEEMLRADVLVLESFGFRLRGIGDLAKTRRQAWLRASVRTRQLVQLSANRRCERRWIRVHLADNLRNDPFALFDQRQQQMLRHDLRVALPIGKLLRGEDRLLSLLGVFVDVHIRSQLSASASALSSQLSALSSQLADS